ncbi:MAG: FAD:protein FMN transferase [Clostridia bacterium]|nr:FAD:protein FMN transferase [Clostridia bacterium]
MKKYLTLVPAVAMLLVCGCAPKQNNSATRFMLDTVVNISASCNYQTLNEAFELCEQYENKFSKTLNGSEVFALNMEGEGNVSPECIELIGSAQRFYNLSGGRFDVTVGALSNIWDFKEQKVPQKMQVLTALKGVGFDKLQINGNFVKTNGTKLDFGGIAKGYIADKLAAFFKEQKVESAVINLGGNVVLLGEEYSNIGIKNPFKDGNIATVRVKNKAVATAGTYERTFSVGNEKYHHILDVSTGYPANTDVISASVICNSATEADALSTCVVLLGAKNGLELIEQLDFVEAIVITNNGEIKVSSGLYCENGVYLL